MKKSVASRPLAWARRNWVAGDPATRQVLKCQLKSFDPGDYAVSFSAAQWTTLRSLFPSGVCDYRRPGVGQQPSVPWLTFAAGPNYR